MNNCWTEVEFSLNDSILLTRGAHSATWRSSAQIFYALWALTAYKMLWTSCFFFDCGTYALWATFQYKCSAWCLCVWHSSCVQSHQTRASSCAREKTHTELERKRHVFRVDPLTSTLNQSKLSNQSNRHTSKPICRQKSYTLPFDFIRNDRPTSRSIVRYALENDARESSLARRFAGLSQSTSVSSNTPCHSVCRMRACF